MSSKLQKGAETAINHCIKLQKDDRIVIITDTETLEVGEALNTEAKKITQNILFLVIEDFTERPAKNLPQALLDKISEFKPNVSIYAAQGKQGEYPVFRSPLIDFLAKELECRHAHMILITKQIMEDGMNQDFNQIYQVTNNIFEIVRLATKIRVTDPHGTDITFDLDPTNIKWIPDDGLIRKIHYANLPGGEVFTAPKNANGVFVGWILGEYMSTKYGPLKEPITIEVTDGIATKISGPEPMRTELEEYIHENENGNRLGELGIGTLVGLKDFIGNLLQDEKFPGVHIAFGSPYPEKTGATWEAKSHIDTIAKDTTIEVFIGEQSQIIMKDGIFMEKVLIYKHGK